MGLTQLLLTLEYIHNHQPHNGYTLETWPWTSYVLSIGMYVHICMVHSATVPSLQCFVEDNKFLGVGNFKSKEAIYPQHPLLN